MIVRLVRWGLPGGFALAGLVLIAVSGGGETVAALGVLLIGLGLIVALCNALLRLSFQSQKERDREQRAREYFNRHGHWPRESH